MKEKLPPGEKRKKQPDEGLTLDHVFGYDNNFFIILFENSSF